MPDTSYRIMETNRYGHSIVYRAQCLCSSEDHDLWLELAIDTDLNSDSSTYPLLSLNLSCKTTLLAFDFDNFFKQLRTRIQYAWKILWTCEVETTSEFLMDSKEQVEAFLGALEEGKGYLNNRS